MSSGKIGHLPALDGLRAIAVVAVVAFHTGLIDGGWLGVEVFFVLSGFLITSILLVTFPTSRTTTHNLDAHPAWWSHPLPQFWIRRFRRLLPAIVVFLVLLFVLYALDQVDLPRLGVTGAVTYSSNWLQVFFGDSYWSKFNVDPTTHLWSLAIEEQVYLVWPIVVFFVMRRFGRRPVGYVAVGLAAVSYINAAISSFGGRSHNSIYLGTDTRCGAFLVGAALATLAASRGLARRARPAEPLLVAVAGGAVLGAMVVLDGTKAAVFRGPLLLVGLLSGYFIVRATRWERGPLTWTPIQAVGRWSYGIYVFHYPFVVARGWQDRPDWQRFLGVMLVSTLIAAVSYHLVEHPIRMQRMPRQGVLMTAVAGVTLAVAGLAMGRPEAPRVAALDAPLAPRSLPATTAPPSSNVTDAVPPTTPAGPIAETTSPPTAPPTTKPGAGLRVVIVGDSVPAFAKPQIDRVAAERGILVDVYAKPGCVMTFALDEQYVGQECIDFINSFESRVRSSDPDVVIVWFGATGFDVSRGGALAQICSQEGITEVRERLRAITTVVGVTGASVMVVTPVPRTDQTESAGPMGTACENSATRGWAKSQGSPLIELAAFVCPLYPDDCERVPRTDGLHYSPDGGITVANFVFDEMARLMPPP